MAPNFRLYSSVTHGSNFISDISHRITHWHHTTRDVGGYWSATCEYQATRGEMDDLFYRGLLREIRASRAGFSIWDGFLGAMQYTRDGVTWTQSIDGLANAVRALYTRIGENLCTNGSAESGPWTVVNGATVEQSTAWVTQGNYSCLITVNDTTVRGADVEPSVMLYAETAYNISIDVHVTGGSWRIAVNKTGDDAKIAAKSTKGKQGDIKIQFSIPATNAYQGTVRFRITSEASAGSIYCDNAMFQEAPFAATTNWKEDAASLNEFGRIENVLYLNTLTEAAANARAQTVLYESSWPISEPPSDDLSGSANRKDKLQLTFFGYIFTARWRYGSYAAVDTMTNYVLSALALQSQYLQRGLVKSNATEFQADTNDPISLWKMLSEIAAAGDESGNPWTLGVYADRKLNYLPRDPATLYTFRGGIAYDKSGHRATGYLARPGWAEFVDAPRSLGSATINRNRTTTRVYIREIEYDGDTDRAKYHRITEGE